MKIVLAALALIAFAAPGLGPARAQSTDFRVDQLQEEVRRLNGRVEELSFQLLQMEERMRKMQEDNEFRFQELEDAADGAGGGEKKSDTGSGGKPDRLGKSSGGTEAPIAGAATGPAAGPASDERIAGVTPPGRPPAPPARPREPTEPREPRRGTPPRPLGTLTFDADGNLVTAVAPAGGPRLDEEPLPQPGEAGSPFADADAATDAAAEYGATPGAVFARAKTLYETRDFADAERAFRAHLAAWPKDPRGPAARYYLGQSLFWQKKYYDAASVLLDTHNAHPDARTAPDTLLALGLSLAGLDQREVACATYAEVLKRYPHAAGRLGGRVKAEQDAARC